jgi:hypothetical protein
MEKSAGWKGDLALVVAWFASTALLIVDVLVVRGLALAFVSWLGWRQAEAARQAGGVGGYSGYGWTIELVDRGALLLLACAGVALSLVIEYYYRSGLQQGLFARRLARVTAIQAGIVLVSLLLQLVYGR